MTTLTARFCHRLKMLKSWQIFSEYLMKKLTLVLPLCLKIWSQSINLTWSRSRSSATSRVANRSRLIKISRAISRNTSRIMLIQTVFLPLSAKAIRWSPTY
uniref:ORF 100 n=1 Tax=Lactococcus phage mv4 TaxID=12392 RepID=Q9G0C0_BPMV4|nr:ORF 100 [Lactobacillus phage mv4]